MSATYSASTGRITLTGDGSGWQRSKLALPEAPGGTNQAIYVFRYWFDTLASNTQYKDSGQSWDTSFHNGLSFGSSHPVKGAVVGSAAADAAYADFLGPAQYASSSGTNDCSHTTANGTAALRDASIFCDSGGTTLGMRSHDGNGGSGGILRGETQTADTSSIVYTIPRTEAIGLTYTYVWRVFSSDVDDEVYFEGWVNDQSFNLSTLDLTTATSLDPDSPKTSIPVSNSWEDSVTINGAAETGTNWRPTTGVMAFPTNWFVMYPMDTQSIVLDYCGVQYSRLTS